MSIGRLSRRSHVLVLLLVAPPAWGQGPAPRPAAPLAVLSDEGRRQLPVAVAGGQEVVALDDLASMFRLAVREDDVAGGVTISHRGRTIVLTPGQPLASVAGRLVTLPSPPWRDGRRWFVPLDFIPRALAPVYEARLELRRPSRLLIVGDLRVPRIAVRVEPAGAGARVTLDVSPKAQHAVVPDQGRLMVRFEADFLDVSLAASQAVGPVQGVRIVDPATTVAIDLQQTYASHRVSSAPSDAPAGGTRIVIDIASTTPATEVPLPRPSPPAAAQPVAPPLGLAAERGIRTVVVDPGHGGEETGAKGPTGVLEKDLALAVARRLRSAIESRTGLRVLLTRDDDSTPALDDRAAFANNNQADLFISLHANASARLGAKGAEVFYLATEALSGEAPDPQKAPPLPVVGGGTRQIDVILWEMAQTQHLRESAAFAAIIEEELRRNFEMTPRPVQQAPFRVLVGANMPAVLVEMGFLTNPDEEQQLVDPNHQALIVRAIVDALLRFRESVERGR